MPCYQTALEVWLSFPKTGLECGAGTSSRMLFFLITVTRRLQDSLLWTWWTGQSLFPVRLHPKSLPPLNSLSQPLWLDRSLTTTLKYSRSLTLASHSKTFFSYWHLQSISPTDWSLPIPSSHNLPSSLTQFPRPILVLISCLYHWIPCSLLPVFIYFENKTKQILLASIFPFSSYFVTTHDQVNMAEKKQNSAGRNHFKYIAKSLKQIDKRHPKVPLCFSIVNSLSYSLKTLLLLTFLYFIPFLKTKKSFLLFPPYIDHWPYFWFY